MCQNAEKGDRGELSLLHCLQIKNGAETLLSVYPPPFFQFASDVDAIIFCLYLNDKHWLLTE